MICKLLSPACCNCTSEMSHFDGFCHMVDVAAGAIKGLESFAGSDNSFRNLDHLLPCNYGRCAFLDISGSPQSAFPQLFGGSIVSWSRHVFRLGGPFNDVERPHGMPRRTKAANCQMSDISVEFGRHFEFNQSAKFVDPRAVADPALPVKHKSPQRSPMGIDTLGIASASRPISPASSDTQSQPESHADSYQFNFHASAFRASPMQMESQFFNPSADLYQRNTSSERTVTY